MGSAIGKRVVSAIGKTGGEMLGLAMRLSGRLGNQEVRAAERKKRRHMQPRPQSARPRARMWD